MNDTFRNHLDVLNFGPLSTPFVPLSPPRYRKIFSIVNTVTSHIPLFNQSQTVKATDLSCVFCHMSHSMCYLSRVTFRIKKEEEKVMELVCGGFVINSTYPDFLKTFSY